MKCGVGAHNSNDWKLQNCSANRFLPTQQDRFVPLSPLQLCLSFKSLNDGCFRFYIGFFSVKIHHEMLSWCSCSGLCNETTTVGWEIESHDKIPWSVFYCLYNTPSTEVWRFVYYWPYCPTVSYRTVKYEPSLDMYGFDSTTPFYT